MLTAYQAKQSITLADLKPVSHFNGTLADNERAIARAAPAKDERGAFAASGARRLRRTNTPHKPWTTTWCSGRSMAPTAATSRSKERQLGHQHRHRLCPCFPL